jgi:hypothetical protein
MMSFHAIRTKYLFVILGLYSFPACHAADKDVFGAYVDVAYANTTMNIEEVGGRIHVSLSGGAPRNLGAATPGICIAEAEGKLEGSAIRGKLIPFTSELTTVTADGIAQADPNFTIMFDKGRAKVEIPGAAQHCGLQSDLSGTFQKIAGAGWRISMMELGDFMGQKRDDVSLVLVATDKAKDLKGKNDRILLLLARKTDDSLEEVARSKDLLLCNACTAVAEAKSNVSVTERKVIVVQQVLAGGKTEGIWRFRLDDATKKMRLIGLDIKRQEGTALTGTSESTNYLTGKRVTASYRTDASTGKDNLSNVRTSAVDVPKTFLENADWKRLEQDQ